MEMAENQVNKLISIYYNDDIEMLVNNLEIDSKTQSCYLKFKKE